MEKTEDPAVEMTRQLQMSLAKLTTALTTANAELAELARALIHPASPSKRDVALFYLNTQEDEAYGNLTETITQIINLPKVKTYFWELQQKPSPGDIVIIVPSAMTNRFNGSRLAEAIQKMPLGVDILGVLIPRFGSLSSLLPSPPYEDESPPLTKILIQARWLPVWQVRFHSTGVLVDDPDTRAGLAGIKRAIEDKLKA